MNRGLCAPFKPYNRGHCPCRYYCVRVRRFACRTLVLSLMSLKSETTIIPIRRPRNWFNGWWKQQCNGMNLNNRSYTWHLPHKSHSVVNCFFLQESNNNNNHKKKTKKADIQVKCVAIAIAVAAHQTFGAFGAFWAFGAFLREIMRDY